MNVISKKKQGIIAIICAIAMIVTSLTIYNPREAKADTKKESVDGKEYSVTVSKADEWPGFDCQGIFDKARIHFAWGIDVDANSITALISEKGLKTDGKSARGMFIPLTEVTGLGEGDYEIVVKATTLASDDSKAKEISATVNLKIGKAEETTTRDPSIVVWKDISDGYSYNDNTKVKVINIQQPSFAKEKGIYMEVPAGIESVTVNGNAKGYVIQGAGTIVYLSALVEGENTITIKYAGGEGTIIVKKEKQEETTTTTEETTINPKDWTTATSEWSATDGGVWHIWAGPGTSVKFKNYDTLNDYYVNITTATGEWQVQTYSIISNLTNDKAYDYKVTIESDKENAYVRIKEDNSNSTLIDKTLVNGTNTLEGSFTAKNGAAKIIMDMGNSANNGATFHVTGVEITEHKTAEQTGNIVEGKKWQVWMQEESWANYVISTDATNYKLENKNIGENWYSIQTGIDGVEFMADTDYVCTFTLKSDKPKEFTFDNRSNDVKVFTESNNVGWQKADDGKYIYKYKGTLSNLTYQMVNIRISLGYHSNKDGKTDENYSAKETATFELSDFQIVKASEYQETTYTVTVDGKTETVQKGTAITAPADGQGYYDVDKDVAYAPGKSIAVNSDMNLKSIDLHVAMASGASIRLAAPTGLRFQTIITSNGNLSETELNDILDQNKKIVNTGTLITAYNLFTSNANKLEKDSDYANLDIANSGWYKNEIGKFCGSIIKIKKENYGRKFIAVGYATINYENGEPKTVYASVTENNAKSIKYIAEKIIDADEYKNYTDAQKAVINAYIDGKEISE